MTNIIQVINSLQNLMALSPATDVQIGEAEQQLGLVFADEYKEYLATFGAIMAYGIELSGIAKSEYRNVVSLTKKEWELNAKVPHTMYAVQNTCIDGIIIWQDSNGLIYKSSPFAEPCQIASSLTEYILNYN